MNSNKSIYKNYGSVIKKEAKKKLIEERKYARKAIMSFNLRTLIHINKILKPFEQASNKYNSRGDESTLIECQAKKMNIPNISIFNIEKEGSMKISEDSMKNEQATLEQIVTELDYVALKSGKKKLDSLSLDQLRALIAYETWKDGQDDWEEVAKIWLGITNFEEDIPNESIMDELVNTFGY